MTRRSRRELERAADRLEDRRPDDDDGAPRVVAGFVDYAPAAGGTGAAFETVACDADLDADAPDDAPEPEAETGAEAATDGGVDPDADDVNVDESADPDPDAEREGEPADEPIQVSRMTRLRRRQFAEGRGRHPRQHGRFY